MLNDIALIVEASHTLSPAPHNQGELKLTISWSQHLAVDRSINSATNVYRNKHLRTVLEHSSLERLAQVYATIYV